MEAGLPQPPQADWDFWSHGLNREFFRQVYVRSSIIGAIAILVSLGLEQQQVALGLLAGVVLGVFSLWTVEWTVRLLFQGGQNAGLKLAIAGIVKMPALIGGLLGIAGASYNGYMNIFAVIGGVLLIHGTMVLMGIGTSIAQLGRNQERYR